MMMMNCTFRWLAARLGLGLTPLACLAGTELGITAFDSHGNLSYVEVSSAQYYRVEWACSLDGPWRMDWSELGAIPNTGLGSNTVQVPMFYRVVGSTGGVVSSSTSQSPLTANPALPAVDQQVGVDGAGPMEGVDRVTRPDGGRGHREGERRRGLVTAWWPGDCSPRDIVGGFDARLVGDASYGDGVLGRAFRLPGGSGYVEVPHAEELNVSTSDFSLDCWVNFETTAGEQVLVEKWVQAYQPSGWTLTKLENNVLRLALAEGGGEVDVDSPVLPELVAHEWVHVAAVRCGERFIVYVNGEPVATGTALRNLDTTASIKFGHRGDMNDTVGSIDGRGFFLSGRIDEVRYLVGRALSAAELAHIHRKGRQHRQQEHPRGPEPASRP